MKMTFVEELRWRGMLQDLTPGLEEWLAEGTGIGYIGFDPTSDSLHIGSLVQIYILKHFQLHGHKPVALIGGATGMIGDPSGKSKERNLLDETILQKNLEGIKTQLERFLDFNTELPNGAILVNNYDWMKEWKLLDFIRDIGKHITVNYMMAKDSVKSRLGEEASEGMSFTEFTYQLFQGFDFLHLYESMGCKLQMGGSDQWGNITTGTELIRRKLGGKAYALTCPLITKADGTKFGKSEGGNVWLDREKTSPYSFYQYWLNVSDADAENYIKIFTFLDKDEINALINEHHVAPHNRILQRSLAEEVTRSVHGQEDLNSALRASEILFGSSTEKDLRLINEQVFLEIFEGIPLCKLPKEELAGGIDMVAALAARTGFMASNGEARRELQQKSISVNKQRVDAEYVLTKKDLINNQYVLLQKGKKVYYLIQFI